jgi:hypothetical protein
MPFSFVINALNVEGEFAPNAIPTPYVVKLPDGKMVVKTLLPYWVRLRDEAVKFYESRGLAKEWGELKEQNLTDKEILARLAVHCQKPRIDGTPHHIPPDADYRKAQDILICALKGLVEKWHESNWNLAACFKKYPAMKRQIEGFLRRDPLAILPASRGASLVMRPGQIFPRRKDKPIARARREATILFIELVRNPNHERLGKCPRCHRFFFGRVGQKCCPRPRRCSSTLAAIKASKRNWRTARQRKLEQARAQCVEWQRRRPPRDWKPWVANQIGVSPKWITRAINLGELTAPQERSKEVMASTTQKVT